MPTLEQLPPDCREQYIEEQQEMLRKQEAAKKKRDEKEQRQRQSQERESYRKMQLAQQAASEHQRQAEEQVWRSQVAEAKRVVPEDDAPGISYPNLKMISSLCVAAAILDALVSGIVIVFAFARLLDPRAPEGAVLAAIAVVLLAAILSILVLMLAAESIRLMVSVADDIRVAKALLKRMAYRQHDETPQHASNP